MYSRLMAFRSTIDSYMPSNASADVRELVSYLCLAHREATALSQDIRRDVQRYEVLVKKVHDRVPEYAATVPQTQEAILDCALKVVWALQDVFGHKDMFDYSLTITHNMSQVLRAFAYGEKIGICFPIAVLTRLVLKSFGVESEVLTEHYFIKGRYDIHARNAVIVPDAENEGGDHVFILDRSRVSLLGDIVQGQDYARGVLGAALNAEAIAAHMLFESTRQERLLSAQEKLDIYNSLKRHYPKQSLLFWDVLERQTFLVAVQYPVGSLMRQSLLSVSAELFMQMLDILYVAHGALLHKEDIAQILNIKTDADTFIEHMGVVLSDMNVNGFADLVEKVLQHPLFQPSN